MQEAFPVTAHTSDYPLTDRQVGSTGAAFPVVVLLTVSGTIALSVLVGYTLIHFREAVTGMGNWGYLGIFLAEMGNSAAILIPTPGSVYTLSMASVLNPAVVGLIGGIGAALGEIVGYMLGVTGRRMMEKSRIYTRLQSLAGNRVGPALFVFAILPLPFDFAGIWAGTIRYSPVRFLIYIMPGKILKVTFIAYGGYYGVNWLLKVMG